MLRIEALMDNVTVRTEGDNVLKILRIVPGT